MPGIAAVRHATAPAPRLFPVTLDAVSVPAPSSRADSLRPLPARWAAAAFFPFPTRRIDGPGPGRATACAKLLQQDFPRR